MLLLIELEFRRQIGLLKSRYISEIVTQVVYILSFLLLAGLSNIVADGHFDEQQQLSFLVGYITWWIAGNCIRQMPLTIIEDARWGTLEQIRIRGSSLWGLMFARSIIVAAYYSLQGLFMVALIALFSQLSLPMIPIILVPYAVTLIGVFGISFVFVGMNIVYKNTSTLSDALSFMLFFLGGTLFSFSIGSLLYVTSRLFPLAAGIAVMRAMVEGLPTNNEWFFLVGNSAVYFLFGLIVLSWSFRRAQMDGSLAHY